MAANNFKIASFNIMNGPLNDLPMLTDLINTMNIIAAQEHWLRERQFDTLCKINNDFGLHAVSAMNQDNILVGRPYSGTGIFWHQSYLTNVKLFHFTRIWSLHCYLIHVKCRSMFYLERLFAKFACVQ